MTVIFDAWWVSGSATTERLEISNFDDHRESFERKTR